MPRVRVGSCHSAHRTIIIVPVVVPTSLDKTAHDHTKKRDPEHPGKAGFGRVVA
jgi:hypothetical protein